MNIKRHDNNNNELLISAASTIEQMKYEIASELGVTLVQRHQYVLMV